MARLFGFFNYEREGPGVRKDAPEKNVFAAFWEIFFENFWRFIPVNLFYMLLMLPIFTGGWATLGAGACLFLIGVASVMNFYAWTMLITFRFTTGQILKYSFRFVFLNLGRNILCAVILALTGSLFVLLPLRIPHPLVIFLTVTVYLCVFPGFRHLLIRFCTFSSIKRYIIDPYYKEHPDDDVELRRNLGLETEEKHGPESDETDEDNPHALIFRD